MTWITVPIEIFHEQSEAEHDAGIQPESMGVQDCDVNLSLVPLIHPDRDGGTTLSFVDGSTAYTSLSPAEVRALREEAERNSWIPN